MHPEVQTMISISILSMLMFTGQAPVSDNLGLILRLGKHGVIRVGEKVNLEAGFRNNGQRPLWLDGRIAYKVHLNLRVSDKHGNEVIFPGSQEKIKLPPPVIEDFVRLSGHTELLRNDLTSGNLVFSKPGPYTLTLIGSHGSSGTEAKQFGIPLARIGAPARLEIYVYDRSEIRTEGEPLK